MSAPPHTAATVAEAQRLHDGGWTPHEISGLLRRRGISVHKDTVLEWVEPAEAERRREQQRQRMRRSSATRTGGRLGSHGRHSPDFRMHRVRNLSALGMSAAAVATVMSFDFPDQQLSGHQVRYALKVGHLPSVRERAPQSTGIRTDVRVESGVDIRRPGGAQTPRATAHRRQVP